VGDDVAGVAGETYIAPRLLEKFIDPADDAEPSDDQKAALAATLSASTEELWPPLGDPAPVAPVRIDRQSKLGNRLEPAEPRRVGREEMAQHLEKVAAAKDAGNAAEVARLEKAAELLILRERVEALP
jgi:hypothetical protein